MKYILLHGMGQNASSWDKTISYLSDKAETISLGAVLALNYAIDFPQK